ncbi:MAG: TonB-dependent receptor [Acidobacteriia bacterium]|nr:TonB-dependent receptor [Terriglobia bacterium]
MSVEKLLTVQIDSVYSSSKFQQKITEAPASVTIISAEEIQKFGYQTLADILRDVPGFYVTYDRNYSYLGFRGFGQPGDYNSRVQLLVDGHLLNDDIYGQALLGTEFPVDLDLIDRIEIVRGPNSSLYIASAFFGVINVITKRGGSLGGLAVSGAAGSDETYRSRVSYGRDFDNGLEVLLSGSFYASQGADALFFKEFDNPLTNNGIARNADGDQFQQLFADHGSFTFQGVYGSRDKHIPTGSFATVFNDPGSHTVDMRSYADLQYQHKIAGGWQLAARLYFDKYDYEGTYVYSSADPDVASTVTQKDLGYGTWLGGEAVVSNKLFDRHHVTVGSSYRQHLHQDQATYNLQPFSEYVNDQRSSTDWGLYIQDEVRLPGSLIVNVGLRYDHYSTFGGATSPRAALIYNPFEKTTFKLLCSQKSRLYRFLGQFAFASGSSIRQRAADPARAFRQLRSPVRQHAKDPCEQRCPFLRYLEPHFFEPQSGEKMGRVRKYLQHLRQQIRRSRRPGTSSRRRPAEWANVPDQGWILLLTPMIQSRRGGTWACLVYLWLAVCVSPCAWPQVEQTVQYPLKLAFIYNMTKFVEWPLGAFSSPSAALTICVVGHDPFPADAERELRSRMSGGRHIDIQRITTTDNPGVCQVVFISDAEREDAAGILARTETSSVLTIGESQGFVERGGIVNLVTQNANIRFEINIGAAVRKRLIISSRLLALAKIVRDQGTR